VEETIMHNRFERDAVAATTAGGARATIVLERGEVITIGTRGRPYRVSCIAGRLWTTIGGDPADAVLACGQSVTYRKRGRIVIEALRTATVRIECHGIPWPECPGPARVVLDQAVPSPRVSADSHPRMAFFLSTPSP
jgi:hypothetical protein